MSASAQTVRAVEAVEPENPLVLLAGNPNCGKTTIFNALTGLRYKVGNYPGVTVEKKEGKLELPENLSCRLVDLPGVYTLSGESVDEQVASSTLAEGCELVVIVADASNIERNLFVASELIDLGQPAILVLNMSDLAEERGIKIRSSLLSSKLDVPVVKLSANKKEGIEQLKAEILSAIANRKPSSKALAWTNRSSGQVVEFPAEKHSKDYSKIASLRYAWINKIVKESVVFEAPNLKKTREAIDRFVTHQVSGLVVFFSLMALIFQSIFTWAGAPMDLIDGSIGAAGEFLSSVLPAGQLRSLLIDGVLAGVGSVLIFIPQIAMLFFFIGLLEDSGYLTRAAVVMDRIMRKFGLQGRSFIPMLSSFACAIPGIMSTRSIPSLTDRFVTILVAPLMSCSARLPVYTLLIAAFIPATMIGGVVSVQGLVMLSLYLLGIVFSGLVAWLLKGTFFKGEPALFVMELPPLKFPNLSLVLRDVWERVWVFIKDAGTIIFACSIVLWFLASYPMQGGEAPPVAESYAGQLGKAIEPAIAPLGYDWKIGIGLLASFAAREVFVSTLATVYNLESEGEAAESLTSLLKTEYLSGEGLGLAAALGLLVFYVFACQCMSTLAVCKRETNSWRWPIFMFLYMTALAWGGAFITYRVAGLLL